jgi:hypothetical protein
MHGRVSGVKGNTIHQGETNERNKIIQGESEGASVKGNVVKLV